MTPETYITKTRAGQTEKLHAGYFENLETMKVKMAEFWAKDLGDNAIYCSDDDDPEFRPENYEGPGYYEEGELIISQKELDDGVTQYTEDVYTYKLYTAEEAKKEFGADTLEMVSPAFV